MKTMEERAEAYALERCGGLVEKVTKGMIYAHAKREYIRIATEQLKAQYKLEDTNVANANAKINFIRMLKESIRKILFENNSPKWKEIKYFHPSGKGMPNGVYYQRGGFIQECKENFNNFILDEGVHNQQYGLDDNRGGIIVFSTDVNAVELENNKIVNKIKQIIVTFKNRFKSNGGENIGAYSVGNFFKGKYVGDNGEMYNVKSLAVEINGLSSKSLMTIAEMMAKEFMQETVLVKDLKINKIFYLNFSL